MIRKIFKILGFILVIILAVGAFIYFKYMRPKPLPISPEDRAAIQIMPLPAMLKLDNGKFRISANFGYILKGPGDEVIERAVSRFMGRTSKVTGLQFGPGGQGLIISYDSATLPAPPVHPDESYQINLSEDRIELKAKSGYGVLHGLESLSQLIKKDGDQFYFPELELIDSPRYPWRGVMIDVCRHWIPKEIILRNLEAMAVVKLNVLHWHLSEYQAIRIESKVFPLLQEKGSNGNYYSQDDIREVVAFARDRGIRVIPEFDMPGHTTGFFAGYPELASAPGPYALATGFGVFKPVMDASREEVYDFIDRFVGEMSGLFPDPFFHIGGDEVDFSDWDNNPAIRAFMKQNDILDSHGLQAYFNQRLQKILQKHNKRMVGWDEILNPHLGADIVVQSWRTHKSLFEALGKGNQAILSAGYYLDHKLPASKHYQVDPEVLPGAVTIQPDSLHWQMYDLSLYVSETPMKTNLVLYGENHDLRGLFYMMDNATAFEKAGWEEDKLEFSFQTDFGEIDFTGRSKNDSLSGTMSLGMISFPFNGVKTGGNDQPGTQAPRVEQIKPLTEGQKQQILGGEAALWTEAVSRLNIDSRIWPRTVAMAEKWWTPAVLTRDESDMYRRLEFISAYLDQMGLQHLKGQELLLTDLAQGKDPAPLKVLADVLEEVKYYERLSLTATTTMPMNEVVDAVQPESFTARHFLQMTDTFLADSTHKMYEGELTEMLKLWRNNHSAFQTLAQDNPRLQKVMVTSEELSIMSNFALAAVDALTGRKTFSKEDKEAMKRGMTSTSRAYVILAVSPGLMKLVDAIP